MGGSQALLGGCGKYEGNILRVVLFLDLNYSKVLRFENVNDLLEVIKGSYLF